MITQYTCPTCNKRTDVIEEKPFLSMTRRVLKCGHSELIKKLESNGKLFSVPEFCKAHNCMCVTKLWNGEEFASITGKHLMPFQADTVEFAVTSANGNAGIFHEMGLGKTVIVLAELKLKSEMLPAIIICKSIAKSNWLHHIFDWLMIPAQMITTGGDKWFPQYQIHVISYEMLRLCEGKEREDIQAILERVKTVIIDESHLIKSDTAKRTIAVKKVCKNAKYKNALSGTPFKNQGAELFSTLNILRPDRFHNKQQFIIRYWDYYRDGWGYKIGGLRDRKRFENDTKDFIIRQTMNDVLPDLPPVRRNNIFVELGKEVQELYDKKLREFAEFYESNKGMMKGFEFSQNILARMNQLRHLTGMAKIDAGVDFVDNFLISTERKLVVFVHHHKVADFYIDKINESIKLVGGMDQVLTLGAVDKDRVQQIVDEFKNNDKKRVLVASTLAAGESINLQFCSDCLLTERQWNPANEEQAGSGRFRRIGQTKTVNFNYLIATGTIDEYFTELVEKKRAIFENTFDGKEYTWDETNIIMEMGEILAREGRKRWQLQ